MIMLLAEEPDARVEGVILDIVLQLSRERKMRADIQGLSLSRVPTRLNVVIINLSRLDGMTVVTSIATAAGVLTTG